MKKQNLSISIVLIVLIMFFSSCTTFNRQSRQLTTQIERTNPKFIDSCETYSIQSSFEILAQTKKKWMNINFSDKEGIQALIKYIKENVDYSKNNNKAYIKLAKGEYSSTEKAFYKKLL